MFAITVTAMLAIIGLLYSFGLILSQRRILQNTADAASLGGAWQVLRELESNDRSDVRVKANIDLLVNASGGTLVSAYYMVWVPVAAGPPVVPAHLALTSTAVGSIPISSTPFGQFDPSARGVEVTVNTPVNTVLPGLVNVSQVLVQTSGRAAAMPTGPPLSNQVIPIGASQTNVTMGATYDLLTSTPSTPRRFPALDLGTCSPPQPSSNSPQDWSDGMHTAPATSPLNWELKPSGCPSGNVGILAGGSAAPIVQGLQSNVLNQGLRDRGGNLYGLVTLAVYDTFQTSGAPAGRYVHVIGFAQIKVPYSAIGTGGIVGTFVPYAAAAWGTPVTPATGLDFGAVMVALVP